MATFSQLKARILIKAFFPIDVAMNGCSSKSITASLISMGSSKSFNKIPVLGSRHSLEWGIGVDITGFPQLMA